MEGERGRASSLGPGARAGSVRANVCVYMCLRVCAHAQTDTKLLAGVGSVAGLQCPLARGSGGHCGDHVCPGLLHSPWGPGPRLPTCHPLEGVTGPALQVWGPGLPSTEKAGQREHSMALWARGRTWGMPMAMATTWTPPAGPDDQAGGGDEPPLPQEGGQAVQLPAEELPGLGEGRPLQGEGVRPCPLRPRLMATGHCRG